MACPNGPVTSASAWSAVVTMKGKSSRPNSFTTLASDVVAADIISCVPPRSADCICISLPSCDAGNSRTLSFPPLLAARISANFCTPRLTGWSVLLRWPQRMVRSCTWASAGPANSVIAMAATATALTFMVASSRGSFLAARRPRWLKPNHMIKSMSKYKIIFI